METNNQLNRSDYYCKLESPFDPKGPPLQSIRVNIWRKPGENAILVSNGIELGINIGYVDIDQKCEEVLTHFLNHESKLTSDQRFVIDIILECRDMVDMPLPQWAELNYHMNLTRMNAGYFSSITGQDQINKITVIQSCRDLFSGETRIWKDLDLKLKLAINNDPENIKLRNETVSILTSELVGPALDWSVIKSMGIDTPRFDKDDNGKYACLGQISSEDAIYSPSTDWSQGGPIIDREKISIFQAEGICNACFIGETSVNGPTPLIVAMRCFVTSKMGPKVDIPKLLWTDAMPLLDSGAGNTPTKRNKP